ncbi:MAG TPA: class I SAM-dependent methyltransferase [Nitrospiraceae bacterium]|nr:class I SAM-dependent methyltransferase [Nitrospiraceae bacterium]
MTDRLIVSCPVGCGKDLVETDVALPEGKLLRCAACGQLVSQISESDYIASMGEFDSATGTLPTASSQGRHDSRAARMFTHLREMLRMGEGARIRLLDIGCSTGALMMSAQRCGIDVEGVEPARRAALAAQAAGYKVFPGTLAEAGFPSASFHAATLIEVIEHLREPGDVLREAWRILEARGVLIVGTGNAGSWTVTFMKGGWDYFQVNRHGGHISFFTPQSLDLLAARCGFRVEWLETRHVRFVESYQASPVVYRGLKVLGEVLNVPARLLNRGHDMLAFLRKV